MNLKLPKKLKNMITLSLRERVLAGETSSEKLAEHAHLIWSEYNLKMAQKANPKGSPDIIRMSNMTFDKLADYKKEDFREIVRLAIQRDPMWGNPTKPENQDIDFSEAKLHQYDDQTQPNNVQTQYNVPDLSKVGAVPEKAPVVDTTSQANLPTPKAIPMTKGYTFKVPGIISKTPLKVFAHRYPEEYTNVASPGEKLKPEIHRDNEGNVHIYSGTTGHLDPKEVASRVQQHLLQEHFSKNPYLSSKEGGVATSHQKKVNGITDRLNKIYGQNLRHDASSQSELAGKLHEIGKRMANEGKSFQEIKKAQGDAIHKDYLEGLFGSYGLNESQGINLPMRVMNNQTGQLETKLKKVPAETLKQILITGKMPGTKLGTTFSENPQGVRRAILTALKKNVPLRNKVDEDIKSGLQHIGADLSPGAKLIQGVINKGYGHLVNTKDKALKFIKDWANRQPQKPSRKTTRVPLPDNFNSPQQ